ncbi:MAG: glycosyltransferase family 2 protein [Thermoanaerobaculia bacterium]
MSRPLVSVILPVFNRPVELRAAVACVEAQSYTNWEILIVDDGSTDETARVAVELATNQPDRIRVLQRANGGPGAARETGRLAARGDLLQYLDSDDWLAPEKLALQVEALERRPECGIAYGRCRETGPDGVALAHPERPSDRPLETMFPAFVEKRLWNTVVPLYRRELSDRAGAWLPLWQEEDWEYDVRIAALGPKLAFVDEVVAEHRQHGGARLSGTAHGDRERLGDRAEAHARILDHALSAGVSRESPEMARFARELFLLARQCGLAGLTNRSQDLFHLARRASTPDRASRLDFRLYAFAARSIGWRAAARLSRGWRSATSPTKRGATTAAI